jgi:hypothetical protein
MKSPPKTFVMLALFISMVWLVGCGEDDTVSVKQPTNNPPTTPVIIASATTVKSGETVTLTATEMDPDSDPLVYIWSSGGSFNTTSGQSVVWVF